MNWEQPTTHVFSDLGVVDTEKVAVMGIQIAQLQQALSILVDKLLPGAHIDAVAPLSEIEPDEKDGATKFFGYGKSLRVSLRTADGEPRQLVFRTSRSNDFGHDRRSDRAANALLAFDTFGQIPRHVGAVDVGMIDTNGGLHSLREAGEFYILTDYAEGAPYADDLWRMSCGQDMDPGDMTRCDALADYLADLHSRKIDRPAAYRRAIRDLIGHGEGIFGLIDNYPNEVPGAPLIRLRFLEKLCTDWRFRLRGREGRLARTHGDFHPFNILFDKDDRLAVLDASRGCLGDPADDITCLSINYVFFALEHNGSWEAAFGKLWRRLWDQYLNKTGDGGILKIAPPYLTWRALVLANPLWYPYARPETREVLLDLAEQALEKGRLDLEDVERMFR